MDTEVRYNLFLALKESLNNIVKHSNATEVWLRLRVESGAITLVVEDNGRGFTPGGVNGVATGQEGRIASGLGLVNLELRLKAMGGQFTVTSSPGHGTRVEMRLRVQSLSSQQEVPDS
jgi:signal transduction histidine kinase